MPKIKLSDLSLSEMFAYIKNGEDGFQEVLDEYPEGYVSHRKDGDYIKTNREWHRLSGSSDEFLEYKSGTYFVAKDDLPVRSANNSDKSCFIPKGQEITDIQHFAKGTGIRTLNKLRNKVEFLYGIKTRVEDWTKSKGLCFISDGQKLWFAEIHWYDVKNFGKFDLKEKWDIEE